MIHVRLNDERTNFLVFFSFSATVEVSDFGDSPFAELALVAEAFRIEARHMVGVEGDTAVDVGFDEVAVFSRHSRRASDSL